MREEQRESSNKGDKEGLFYLFIIFTEKRSSERREEPVDEDKTSPSFRSHPVLGLSAVVDATVASNLLCLGFFRNKK